jgi:hypothetical protein
MKPQLLINLRRSKNNSIQDIAPYSDNYRLALQDVKENAREYTKKVE